MVTHFSQEKWNNGEWAPTGEKGGRTVQKEKDAQTTLRLFDKDSQNHIMLHLPKVIHTIAVYAYINMYIKICL